jgi:hypothetical protein
MYNNESFETGQVDSFATGHESFCGVGLHGYRAIDHSVVLALGNECPNKGYMANTRKKQQ